jgi:benzoyl-CoA reductase subunit C
MNPEEVIQRCLEIYEDVGLKYVKKWKRRTGGQAIGYLPIWVPKEIFYAANVLPVGIMGGGDMVEVIQGDSYYQSYICHLPRSTVEMGFNGMIEPLCGIVCPSVCDTVRNLVGVFNVLFPGKYTHYLDVPQNFDPDIGGKWFEHDMRQILKDLESLGGKPVDTESLNHSISLYNRNRRLLREIDQMRSDRPWLIPSHEYYLLIRAGNTLDVEEHNQLLSDYIENVDKLDRKPIDNVRIMLIGGFCEQPPLGLVKTIEMAGCYVVWDDYVVGNRFIMKDIDASSDDPLKAISDAFLFHSTFSSSKYEVPNPKSELTLEIIRERKVDGVILTGPSFCDPILLDVPSYVEAFEKEDIPHITFLFAEDMAQYRVIEEEVGTFSDSIKLWR